MATKSESNLSKNMIRKTSTTTSSITEENKKNDKPPKGADIIEETIRITTEQIENGYLITKNFSGRYKEKGSNADSYGRYYDYNLKWYSEDDPLTITLNDKSLAESFNV